MMIVAVVVARVVVVFAVGVAAMVAVAMAVARPFRAGRSGPALFMVWSVDCGLANSSMGGLKHANQILRGCRTTSG